MGICAYEERLVLYAVGGAYYVVGDPEKNLHVERLGIPYLAEALELGTNQMLPEWKAGLTMNSFALPRRRGGVPNGKELRKLSAQAEDAARALSKYEQGFHEKALQEEARAGCKGALLWAGALTRQLR